MMYTKATNPSSFSSASIPQSILKKLPNGTGPKKSVIFNENLNIFYESNDCLCWLQQQQHQSDSSSYSGGHDPHSHPHASHNHHLHPHHQHELIHTHDYNEIDQPTLSPPEGYKDKIFNLNYQYHQQQQQLQQQQHQQQQFISNPDITHVNQNNPPSPPSAKRKIFLYNNLPIQRDSFDQQQVQGRMVEEYEEVSNEEEEIRRGLRLGGILKGGRLWRSNSSENKKSPEEPDLLKCIETKSVTTNTMRIETNPMPNPSTPIQKISTGTTPLSTSEQIRLAVTLDTKARKINKKQVECSSLVEKLRWLTSLDDDEENLDDLDGSMDYSTWPSRDNKLLLKKDAGTSTSLETEEIKQLNNFKEENELINFIDINRINKIKKQYNNDGGAGDDYGFSHRPSVKGIKNKFGKTVEAGNNKREEKILTDESQYENLNSGGPNGVSATAAQQQQQQQQPNEIQPINEISDVVPIPITPPNANPATPIVNNSKPTQGQGQGQNQGQPINNPEFKTNFQIIRQSFENNATRPYSWSTLPINHQHLQGQQQSQPMGKPGGPQQQQQQQQRMSQQQQQQPVPVPITQHQLNLHLNSQQTGVPNPGYYGTLQSKGSVHAQQQQQYYDQQQQQPQQQQQQQPIYGTIRRVPNVIGRPLFLHYTALSVEAHPNKIIYPKQGQGQGPQPPQQQQQQPQQQQQQPHSTPNKLNDTSPTIQQQLASHYYGPPIRYYNQPPAPPVIPSLCNNLSSANPNNSSSNNGSNAPTSGQQQPHAANNYNIQPVYSHPHVNVLLSCNSNNPGGAEENNLLECRGIPEGRDEADDEYK